MVINLTKDEVERTKDLAEAIRTFFGLNLDGRLCVLDSEAMEGNVAEAYNQLGLNARRGTYGKIVTDFKTRTNYKESSEKRNIILDIGCGSGLLSLELAEKTDGIILGIDISKDMIRLANRNKEERAGVVQYNKARILFEESSVYDLSAFIGKERCADYIVCRNVLHRLKEPEKALEQMLKVLRVGGKIYLRDLRRDADWRTIVERIGAMASMLTTEELEKMLISNGIKDYTIADGSYKNGNEPLPKSNIREFEKDTEYVCIITKSSEGKK